MKLWVAAMARLDYNAQMMPRRHEKIATVRGFTLIEMLIVLALMVVLSVMLYGFGSASHQRTQKELCADNLQKVFLAMQIYANDFGRFPRTNDALTSEPVLNLLVPRYTVDTSTFICPGGRDEAIPSGASLARQKISYAYYMGRDTNAAPRDVLMSDRQVNTLAKAAGDQVFSLDGKSPGNNHHKYGGNFLFCDGSIESSKPVAAFSLALSNGIVLLNPKP